MTQIQVDARAGCTAADLDGFERNTGYALPDDLRAFLAVSNGLKCDWAVDVKTRGPADVGALRLHRLDDIVPVTLDDDDADDAGARARTFRRDDDEGLGRVERAFELDRSARVGRVPHGVYVLSIFTSDDEPLHLDSPLRGAPPFRRAGTVTSVSFPSRGPLSSYGSLDASLCPPRHALARRSASSTARTGAPRPRSGSRTSPAAGTTSRPRSRATSASPSRTWGCAAGRAATRPAARTRSRASGCGSTAPSGSTRTTARRKPPRREDKYTYKSGVSRDAAKASRGEGEGSRALRRCSEWGEASVYTFLSSRVVVIVKQLINVRQQITRKSQPIDCQ